VTENVDVPVPEIVGAPRPASRSPSLMELNGAVEHDSKSANAVIAPGEPTRGDQWWKGFAMAEPPGNSSGSHTMALHTPGRQSLQA
jgi:hypothetical protein